MMAEANGIGGSGLVHSCGREAVDADERPVDRDRWARVEAGECGSAVIEFVMVGLLLLLPVAYLVLVLGRVQAASFAAEGAAREATRAFVTADSDSEGNQGAVIAADLALRDHGFATDDGTLEVSCARSPCLVPGGNVAVEVRVVAAFPWLPAGLADALRAQVVVGAEHVEVVDEFRDLER